MHLQSTEPLLPLVVISGFFIVCLPLFAIHVARHGLPKEDRIENRKVGPFLGRWLMYYLLWIIGPVERLLIRTGVSPNALTFSSLLLSAGSAVALGLGRFGLGGWLYLFTGIFDIFDGRVARATGRVTKGGAFYDSIVDRWAEALIFCGLGWYYRSSLVLFLVMIALVASFMVSYARARGEGLGATGGDVGAMQRPERILYLGVGVALSPLVAAFDGASDHPLHLLAVIALGLVATTALGTALKRSWVIFRQLAETPLDEKPASAPAASGPASSSASAGGGANGGSNGGANGGSNGGAHHSPDDKRASSASEVEAGPSLLV